MKKETQDFRPFEIDLRSLRRYWIYPTGQNRTESGQLPAHVFINWFGGAPNIEVCEVSEQKRLETEYNRLVEFFRKDSFSMENQELRMRLEWAEDRSESIERRLESVEKYSSSLERHIFRLKKKLEMKNACTKCSTK